MNKLATLLVLVITCFVCIDEVYSFSGLLLSTTTNNNKNNDFFNSLRSIFPGNGGKSSSSSSSSSPIDKEREELKQQLLEECQSKMDEKQKRENIENIIYKLSKLTPIQESAIDPALQKLWKLEWTTEKEIIFFIQYGICNGDITQLINGSLLENNIPWKNGGLGVTGDLTTSKDNLVRTEFEFTMATIDLGRWGTYNLPPIGKGWFDTIYLDDELRVDVNSRNDILICTPKSS